MKPSLNDSHHEKFLRLFSKTEPSLRIFVRSLVPSTADADDVLQEVAITLWNRFAEFVDQPDENFQRWSFGVAKYKVLSWKRDLGRDRHVFTDQMTESLAADAERRNDRLHDQQRVLRLCLEKLQPKQRSLVESAYAPGVVMTELAASLELSSMALYKKLHRIRLILTECTRREMKKGESK